MMPGTFESDLEHFFKGVDADQKNALGLMRKIFFG